MTSCYKISNVIFMKSYLMPSVFPYPRKIVNPNKVE